MVELFKNTEIGEYPNDWIVEDFGEIISSVQLGGNYPNNDEDGEFILIKMGNLNRGYIDLKKKYYIKKGITPNEIDRLHFGDVIFNTRNTLDLVGKVAIWKNEDNSAFFNSNIMRIKFNEEKISSNHFMNLILNTPKSLYQLRGIATGTTSVAAIYPRDLFKIKIPYPTKAEQTAIATALNDADALIQKLEQLIFKKRNIKTGAMQELLKPKGGWEEKTLGQIAELYQPETISQEKFTNDGYLVYGANGIIGKYHRYNHEHWQTTITCRGSTCGTVNKTVDKCWITGNAMVANVDRNTSVDKLFFYFLLTMQDFSNCITGSGQPQIVRKPLFEFYVWIPKQKDEQTRIAQILSDMDNEIQEIEVQLAKYRMMKQGMMQSLLTGKIRLV